MSNEPHELLNGWPETEARAALERCCGSRRWAARMLQRRPFSSTSQLMAAADSVWSELERTDYLEAFSHHPRIGADPGELAQKFARTARWSAGEQAALGQADADTLRELHADNLAYFDRFGFIFIVCATGKSADEMLELLRARLHNQPATELQIAASEQAKITRLRLAKLEP